MTDHPEPNDLPKELADERPNRNRDACSKPAERDQVTSNMNDQETTASKTSEETKPVSNPIADTTKPTATSKKQFGIAALFWSTFVVGLGLAYLQRLDSPDILIGGFITVVIGVVVGAIVGRIVNKVADAIFWSTLIAAFGYISVSSDPIYSDLGHRLAWAGVGAITGAIGATCWTNRRALNLFACGIVAFIVMFTFSWFSNVRSADLTIDVNMSPFIGVAIGVFLILLRWVESNHEMPRYVTATWLLVAVIIGNLFR